MPVELVLFDLDDTLLRTDDLADFRGAQFLHEQSHEYVSRLAAKYRQRMDRICYSPERLNLLRQRFPDASFGVFTRSPGHYATILLELAYPDFDWDTLIAFEDVKRTKPSGEGVWAAMSKVGVKDPECVWMVGDGKVDIQAAYDAGCWCVLDRSTWPRRMRDIDWWALERMPDAVITSPSELVNVLSDPDNYLPAAEQLQAINGAARPVGALRVDKMNFFDALEHGRYVPIHFLGRHFSKDAHRRVDWHNVTHDIHGMKDSLTVPVYWISAIRSFLGQLVSRTPGNVFGMGSLVVTVVPAKPGRLQRLEAMLEQLADSHKESPIGRGSFEFLPGLMRYSPGVLSQHAGDGLNRKQRFENVRDHLQVIPNSGYARKHVVVIDDVATTGASLLYSEKYLKAAGASQVTCLALTKALNTQ